jgi:putative membrane protein
MHTTRTFVVATMLLLTATAAHAQAGLNDLEMAHAAVTADAIDMDYARIALARSQSKAVRDFAQTMIRDHAAVTSQVVALAKKLNVQAQDNAFSQTLLTNATPIKATLGRLRGKEFDKFYAENELAYHKAVVGIVADTWIPNIQNPEVKQAFTGALAIFRTHVQHSEMMVAAVTAK